MSTRLTQPGRRSRTIWAVLLLLFPTFTILRHYHASSRSLARTDINPTTKPSSFDTSTYPDCVSDTFQPLPIAGFANLGLQDDFGCSDLAVTGELNITSPIDIDDDLLEIAESVQHPLVDYSSQGESLSFATLVGRTWSRMSGSSVWLDQFGVFLTVSRVYFYDKGVRRWSVVSFIRAQIHDADWNHLQGYELHWQGETIVFPRVFDIPFPFKLGGCFIGPEDPRIIIERGVSGAEPAIMFNMQDDPYTLKRSMYLFRPFSNLTTRLLLNPVDDFEKNWAPFFMATNIPPEDHRWPSRWLHFVYQLQPLTILRCHMLSGACSRIFEQTLPDSFRGQHRYGGGVLRGGSNFEPLHITGQHGISSFVGFPRTHIDEGCLEEAMYRPELTVLSTNGTHFWFDYSSESLNFEGSMLTPSELDDPCTSGRILLIDSIVYFDAASGRDEMTVSFSVNDASISVATIRGVRHFVESLPQYSPTKRSHSHISNSVDVTHRVLGCSIESATDYALEHTTAEMWEAERLRIAEQQD